MGDIKHSIEHIESLRTSKGGFSRASIESLGLTWPPKSGWIQRLTGLTKRELRTHRKKFRAINGNPCRKKKSRAKRKPSVKRTTKSNVAWLPRDEWEKQTARFYSGRQWKELRYDALRNTGGCCCCCGARASDGAQLHVDHIKPRSKYPELQYDLDNLQILCRDCNMGKSKLLRR